MVAVAEAASEGPRAARPAMAALPLVATLALLACACGATALLIAGGEQGMLLVSHDGRAWAQLDAGSDVEDVADGPVTVLAGPGIWTSDDLLTYTRTSDIHAHAVTYGPAGFVAVGSDGAVAVSTDGASWTSAASGTTGTLHDVAYSGMYVAVGEGVRTSPDGLSWTARTGTEPLRGLAAGPVLVAVGDGGLIMTSPDGLAWTVADSGTAADLRSVAYGDGRFVAVSPDGTALRSPDGHTWSTAVQPGLSSVAYDGVFVAVGGAGSVATSPDGATWTVQESGVLVDLLGVGAIALPWPSAPESSISAPATMDAGGQAAVTVRLAGPDGAPLPSGGHDVRLSLAGPGALGPVTDHGDGTYTAAYLAPEHPAAVTVAARVHGLPIHATAIAVVAGPPEPGMTRWSAPESIVADGRTQTVTVDLRDAYGNPTDGDVTLATSLGTLGPVTRSGSVHAFPLGSTATGLANVTATIAGVETAVEVRFVAGPPAASTLSLAPDAVPADGASSASVMIDVRDAQGHPVPGRHVVVHSSLGDVGPVAAHGGTYTAAVTSLRAGAADVTATVDGAPAGAAVVHFLPGPPSPHSTVTAPAATTVGATIHVTVHVRDANGNGLAGAPVTVTSTIGTPGPAVDQGDGTYTATLTSDMPGWAMVAASVADPADPATVITIAPTQVLFRPLAAPVPAGPVDPTPSGGIFVPVAPPADPGPETPPPADPPVPNHPPVAVGAPVAPVPAGALVYLDATASSDPDQDALRFSWQQTGGPPVDLHDAGLARAWFVAPAEGVASFRVTVSDGSLDDHAAVLVLARPGASVLAGASPREWETQTVPLPALAAPEDAATLGLAAAVSVAAALSAAGLWLSRRRILLLVLFTRVGADRLLQQRVRRAIHDLIESEPGIHLNAIRRRLGLGRGQVAHHVRLMHQAGLLRRERMDGYDCYFLAGDQAWRDRDALRALKSDAAGDVLRLLRRAPASTAEVARATGLSASLVRYHTARLREAGLLTTRREGRSLVFVAIEGRDAAPVRSAPISGP